MEIRSFYNVKDRLLFKGREFSAAGVLDTSGRDAVHEFLELAEPAL